MSVNRYQEYAEKLNDLLLSKLSDVFGEGVKPARIPYSYKLEPGDITIAHPETGLRIEVRPLGSGLKMPLTRVSVKLSDPLPGGIGDMRREIRAANRRTKMEDKFVDLDRIRNHVVKIVDVAGPLYQFRLDVKDSVWPVFGVDPREVENWRECKYGGRDVGVSILLDSRWNDGKDKCCVRVALRELGRNSYHQREIEYLFRVGEPIDMDQFRQKIQQELERWAQDDQEVAELRDNRAKNQQAAQKIEKQYQDLNGVSLEGTSDGLTLTVRLKTEEEALTLLECRKTMERGRAQ